MKAEYLLFIFILSIFTACTEEKKDLNGKWRAELYLQGDTLPFNFTVLDSSGLRIQLENAGERLLIDDITFKEDSMIIPMHIFDTEIRTRFSNETMSGIFRKRYADNYVLGFKAEKGLEHRFSRNPQTQFSVDGKWEVLFESALEDSISSIGEFRQQDALVRGTFLTETGDYRYLEGEMDGRKLKLSCFDGEHAFLFEAKLNDKDILEGTFKSGISWNESWTARRNESIELRDSYSLTYLKEAYDSLYFTFPDMQGNDYSYPNAGLDNKVVLIQIFGTWCPNCMDETRFLADWYEKNRDRGLEIIAIDFERKDDIEYATRRVEKMKEKLDARYLFLFGGTSDKAHASESLPMLNKIISFPTLIFIDRQGQIRKIHTGFSGPGTGRYYEEFKKEFISFTDSLLNS